MLYTSYSAAHHVNTGIAMTAAVSLLFLAFGVPQPAMDFKSSFSSNASSRIMATQTIELVSSPAAALPLPLRTIKDYRSVWPISRDAEAIVASDARPCQAQARETCCATFKARDEKFLVSSDVMRDVIIGLADGLTVPFALTAGLATLGNSKLVVIAGMAELVSGAISMGETLFRSTLLQQLIIRQAWEASWQARQSEIMRLTSTRRSMKGCSKVAPVKWSEKFMISSAISESTGKCRLLSLIVCSPSRMSALSQTRTRFVQQLDFAAAWLAFQVATAKKRSKMRIQGDSPLSY